MQLTRVVQYAFFFLLLALSGYMMWQIIKPFITALALSVVIVTLCYPLYTRIKKRVPRHNKTVAALLATFLVLLILIIPLVTLSSLVVKEIVLLYNDLDTGSLSVQSAITTVENRIQTFLPDFEINLAEQIKHLLEWVTGSLGVIFKGTVSTIFLFFIALLGSFYFFRDGKDFLQVIINASPLRDEEDRVIFEQMARSVRAVVTGTVFVALIQGTLVAIGFTIFDIDRAILWGSLAAVGALVPGIGTTIVTAPAIVFHFYTGDVFNGVGLLIWSMVIVGMIDNIIAPYLMSRGNNLHPFLVLISVLGGLVLFGPIGFIIGPVIATLFLVLLEIYHQYVVEEKQLSR